MRLGNGGIHVKIVFHDLEKCFLDLRKMFLEQLFIYIFEIVSLR